MLKKTNSIVLAIMIIFTVTTVSLGEENLENRNLYNILPQGEDYEWNYYGFAEYGHTMTISNISDDNREYSISGQIHDMSGMKSEEELSFYMKYVFEEDALIQYKGTKIIDSDFARIELIKAPLNMGNTWTQKVTAKSGETLNLKCEIVDLEYEDDKGIYTVRYDSIDGDYYEIRKIKEGVGVIYFEKPIDSNDSKITFNYSLNEESSGYKSFNKFKDLDSNRWYAYYVNKLIKNNIISGYPDNTFKPDDNINVSEFTKLLLNTLGYKEANGNDDWYSNYIKRAKQLNIIDEEDYTNYNRPINRQEMAKMIARALGEKESENTVQFDDIDKVESKYKEYVIAAVSLGILEGYPDNTFRPNGNLSRAEASKVIVEVMSKEVVKGSKDKGQALTNEKVISLEEDFKNYLLPKTNSSNVVLGYNSKEELISDMTSIMTESLARENVNIYFEEKQGELNIIPTEGPAMIVNSKPLDFKEMVDGEYLVSQENENALRGRYRLEIYYKNTPQKGWMMTNRIFYPIDTKGNINNNLSYQTIDKNYSEDVATSAQHVRKLRGYGIIKETSDSYIVYIGLGEKPTGGYSVLIDSCVNLVNDTTKIIIKENAPGKGVVTTQAITYPYILVKIDKTNSNIDVETLDGEKLEDINDESNERI